MASHHHPHPYHHHHHNSHPTTAIATTCCCCCCCTSSPHPPPPDPLLQSVASHLLHTPPDQPHLYSPYFNTPYDPHHNLHHQSEYHPPQPHQQKHQQFQRRYQNHHQQPQTQPTVSSLLQRIAALESSLRHQFSANSTAAYSLRDAAARTIQTHFRAFLVRRSRTLRQLKDLAFVKSTLNSLKTSLSDNTRIGSQALSRKAMNLLLKLGSIQGGDPMIRDGKRSVSRELIRFIEFIDGVSLRRNELSSRPRKNVKSVGNGNGNKSTVLNNGHRMGNSKFEDMGGNEREMMEKLRGLAENINGFSGISEEDDEEDVGLQNPNISITGKTGFPQNRNGVLVRRHGGVQAKVKKNVSFAENGNVYRVFRSTHEPISTGDVNGSDESGSVDDERELVDNHCREVEEIGGFAKEIDDEEEGIIDDGGSTSSIDGERNPRRSLRAGGNYEISGKYQGQNGNFVFSAPLPVKMESKSV